MRWNRQRSDWPDFRWELDRIQLRSVAGQVCPMDPASRQSDVVLHQSAAVSRQPIPKQQQGSRQMPDHGLEKVHYLLFLDRSRIETEVEVPYLQSGGNRRGFLGKCIVTLASGHAAPKCGSGKALDPGPLSSTKIRMPPSRTGFFSPGQTFFFQCWGERGEHDEEQIQHPLRIPTA